MTSGETKLELSYLTVLSFRYGFYFPQDGCFFFHCICCPPFTYIPAYAAFFFSLLTVFEIQYRKLELCNCRWMDI